MFKDGGLNNPNSGNSTFNEDGEVASGPSPPNDNIRGMLGWCWNGGTPQFLRENHDQPVDFLATKTSSILIFLTMWSTSFLTSGETWWNHRRPPFPHRILEFRRFLPRPGQNHRGLWICWALKRPWFSQKVLSVQRNGGFSKNMAIQTWTVYNGKSINGRFGVYPPF